MTWDDILASAEVPLPPRRPEIQRERGGCKLTREQLKKYWRPDPAIDLSYADALSIAITGHPAPEPPPPCGWKDWPREPQEAARRLAPKRYGIEPTNVFLDPASPSVIVTGWLVSDN